VAALNQRDTADFDSALPSAADRIGHSDVAAGGHASQHLATPTDVVLAGERLPRRRLDLVAIDVTTMPVTDPLGAQLGVLGVDDRGERFGEHLLHHHQAG
jgi:hypothetical protein